MESPLSPSSGFTLESALGKLQAYGSDIIIILLLIGVIGANWQLYTLDRAVDQHDLLSEKYAALPSQAGRILQAVEQVREQVVAMREVLHATTAFINEHRRTMDTHNISAERNQNRILDKLDELTRLLYASARYPSSLPPTSPENIP